VAFVGFTVKSSMTSLLRASFEAVGRRFLTVTFLQRLESHSSSTSPTPASPLHSPSKALNSLAVLGVTSSPVFDSSPNPRPTVRDFPLASPLA
jgi:hypothetical protein